VELVAYNRVPHMAFPIIVDREKAVEALRWLNLEMDNRYKKFAEVGARNLDDYNKKSRPPLPCLVLFIDELADLMMAAFEEVEHGLCRLAQLARATGIHLIVATQRPSVDVVTGLIKANFPTRLSFAVSQLVDSRTILDMAGAEKLLGRGDMLFLPTEATKPKRLQGCYVSDAEIERLVAFWSRQKGPVTQIGEPTAPAKEGEDSLLEAARRLSKEHRKLSASFLQRQLQVGYPRAVKLMEMLEKEGLAAKENP
ncbi:MAG TPA: FtsK/SpoIIIE domain-containing protein, partial [Dehalococcoidia bacterium]|nr:FtsK/SpoIIIE domain-containing protein [Dehalococcoidia bacterium]